jgi:hypothetical protein
MTKMQDPDPLVRGMDPRIRIWIHIKMSWIRNTDTYSWCKFDCEKKVSLSIDFNLNLPGFAIPEENATVMV